MADLSFLMRRFEFSDGSSSKFWSIDLSGSGFQVVYGRMGTDGREQAKTFDSDDIASREAEKLIKSKVKKGYVEVASAPTSTQAVATVEPTKKTAEKASKPEDKSAEVSTSAPTSNIDYSTPFLSWTGELMKNVLPHRGMEPPKRARAAIKAEAVFRAGIAASKESHPRWAAGEAAAEEHANVLMKRVRARFAGDEPDAFDADLEAGSLRLTLSFLDYAKKTTTAHRAVFFWGQRYGARSAAQALVRASEIRVMTQDASRKSALRLYVPHDSKAQAKQLWGSQGWEALRELFAFAESADFEEGRAWLKEWAMGFAPETHQFQRAAFVLSEDVELRAAILQLDKLGRGADLISLPTTQAEAEKLSRNLNAYGFSDHGPTLVWRVGLGALPLLMSRVPDDQDVDVQRSWVRTMSAFAGLEPARAMARFIDAKSVRPLLGSYFERHPELGRIVLPEVIAATKKKAPREAAKAMLAALSGAADAPTNVELGPSASTDALPPVLQNPPWRSKRKARAGPTFELTRIDVPPELTISKTERDTLRAQQIPRVPRTKFEQLDKAVAGHRGATLGQLPTIEDDELLFRYISTIQRWIWGDAETLRGLIARVGVRIVPFIPAMCQEPETLLGARDLGASVIAPVMAAAAFRVKTKRFARRWLSKFPRHAAVGLIPDAFGSDKKARKTATNALRLMVAGGHGEIIKATGKDYGAAVEKAVDALVDADPLFDAPTKPPKLPPWVDIGRLPRPRLKSGEALSEDSTKHIVEMLVFSQSDPAYAGIEQVSEALSAESANDLARGLCSAWAAAGAKPAWKWAAHSVGHLGNDESARWLVGQIGAWAADGSKSVAVAGLEALGMIGSNIALMPLGRWSRRGRPWLKTGAQEVLQAIAATRGLSPDELEDQSAPTLGLGDDGKIHLDYGARQFSVTFDEQLQPRIYDADGERVAKIPPARKTDDKAKATAAKKTWAALKKDAETLSKAQVERLERAMTTTRTWSLEDFESYLVRHPLVGHLARRLVFAHDRKNTVTTFRVSEDHTYASADDEEFELAPDARISVIHPVRMSDAERAAWGTTFADYEILQPFAQLGRTVHRPTNEDQGNQELSRAKGINAYTGRIFALRSRGWRLDGDPYSLDSARKELAPGVNAWLSWENGIELERPKMQEHLIHRLRLDGNTTLDQLDPLVFSELVFDIESLRS